MLVPLALLCSFSASTGALARPDQRGAAGALAPKAPARSEAFDGTQARQAAALEAGVEAVVYGLPLVLMDITRAKATNVAAPGAFDAPLNQFVHVRAFPDASFKDVVRANVDTLYSSAWLDLAAEPMVLSVPDTGGRYYLMPMLDAWTDVFASPGKRTTGTAAGHFAITGPGWKGTLPQGVQRIESPTSMVWIIGRTQTDGPADCAAVHAIQDGYGLTPLSSFGKPYAPPAGEVDPSVDMKTPPVVQLERMKSADFFARLALLLETNPPPAAEAPILAKLARIGVVPGKPFDASMLDPEVAKGLERALEVALQKLKAAASETGAPVNGWRVPPMVLGNFGSDYGARAVVALVGLGANLPQDAVYPSAFTDGDGRPLVGSQRYVLRFEAGTTPPVEAFWSITMYDSDSFFVANPIGRHSVSSWMPLRESADGAIEILVQHESPGADLESNWLPAPEGPFNLTLRMYWPKAAAPSILDGSWAPPKVRRVE